ncbi:Crp/Fnr family transcriptional regulator [Candidatus Acetothermia bacterium]|jgi:CRP/FNR family transcriptional regulator|nr:Crp/Fnr family transcriptional regulator [Candidatus Acetothermia bacterium]MCI2431253.1 Crp/Fnr family transcriptional regulator [Candidatus Acetothermia bacterium]MCI2436290.1 Crp/Fnr family transcriptional regulator [Candidatus Acetothermia bacterium]
MSESNCCRYCLTESCLFLHLAREDLSFYPEAFTQVLQYEKGQTLFQEGAPAYGYYFICAGRVKLAKRSPNGKKALLEVLGPGDLIAPPTEGPYRLYAEALEPSRVGFVDQRDFAQLLQAHPRLAVALVEKLLTELSKLQERFFTATQPSARAKVAHLLLELAADFGQVASNENNENEEVVIALDLSRAEMAEMAGLARETLSLALGEFEAKSWIKLASPRKIVLCDLKNLQQVV